MDYKVLIKLYMPELSQTYELYIPINKSVYQVTKILYQVIKEASFGTYEFSDSMNLCNRRTGQIYNRKDIIRNTDIRNGSELVIFKA